MKRLLVAIIAAALVAWAICHWDLIFETPAVYLEIRKEGGAQ